MLSYKWQKRQSQLSAIDKAKVERLSVSPCCLIIQQALAYLLAETKAEARFELAEEHFEALSLSVPVLAEHI